MMTTKVTKNAMLVLVLMAVAVAVVVVEGVCSYRSQIYSCEHGFGCPVYERRLALPNQ